MTLKLTNISKSYDGNVILRGVDFEIDRGQLAVITGPSGSGKTTLLRLISLLEEVDTGNISLDGTDYRFSPLERLSAWEASESYRKKLCLVFQQLFMWPHMTIRDAITKSTRNEYDYEAVAQRLGIRQVLDRYPNQISLGQRQRAAIVRALSTQAEFYLFDEITSALDEAATNDVVSMVEEIIKSNNAVVLVTHSPEKVASLIDKKYVIASGGKFSGMELH